MTSTIYITTGTNDAQGETRATTERGYIKAATKLCGETISCGLQRVLIRVVDQDGDEVFCATRTVIA